VTRPATALDALRSLGYSVGWSSSPMDAPFAMAGRVVVLDASRPVGERWAAAEWAAGKAVDLGGRSGPDDEYGR
jgi:hypothetical protein